MITPAVAPSHRKPAFSGGVGADVTMKDPSQTPGHVDGAWQPQSYDSSVEFPALVSAMVDQVGRVARITYDLDQWNPVPKPMTAGGHIVRMEGFHTVYTHQVIVTGVAGRRARLLVVPPDATEADSQRMFRDVLVDHPNRSVADLIAGPVDTSRDSRVKS